MFSGQDFCDSRDVFLTPALMNHEGVCRAAHYGQTRIHPMRFDTKGFLIDSFIFKRDKTFCNGHLNIFGGFLQSSSTQKALQKPRLNFNSI